MSAAQLSFPASEVAKIAKLDGVKDAAGSLTLNAVTIKGTVPKQGFQRPAPGSQPQPQTQRAPFDVDSLSVTGVDESKPALGAIGPDQITKGRYLKAGAAREVVLNESYAKRHGLTGRQDRHARRQVVTRSSGSRARRSAARPPTST